MKRRVEDLYDSSVDADMSQANRKKAKLSKLKDFHNLVKKRMIKGFALESLVDLGCGKGGDLHKVLNSFGIKKYLGLDASEPELKVAKERMSARAVKKKEDVSHMRFEVCDLLLQHPLQIVEEHKSQFTSAMCMFALHYFCQSRETLRMFFQDVSTLLSPEPGCYFFGVVPDGARVRKAMEAGCKTSAVQISPYAENACVYKLGDSVTERGSFEFLVDEETIIAEAARVGLEPVYTYPRQCKILDLLDPADRTGSFFKHFDPSGFYDGDMFHASRMFATFVFQRRVPP